MDSIILNQNQKGHLGITLRIVEEELNKLRQKLHAGEEVGLFFYTGDDLTDEEKSLLDGKIESLMKSMIHLKILFDLRYSHKELSLRTIIKTMALYLQVEIEGVKSAKLKGYGEVQPGLEETLDSKLNEMIAVLRQMETII